MKTRSQGTAEYPNGLNTSLRVRKATQVAAAPIAPAVVAVVQQNTQTQNASVAVTQTTAAPSLMSRLSNVLAKVKANDFSWDDYMSGRLDTQTQQPASTAVVPAFANVNTLTLKAKLQQLQADSSWMLNGIKDGLNRVISNR
jgi:hypothetical protein